MTKIQNKLFTIFLNFSDWTIGIDQYEAGNELEALTLFIQSTESLKGYDRDLLLKSLMPLIHVADLKGLWSFYFHPDLLEINCPDDNKLYGGHIVQTDQNGPVRN